MTKTAYSVIKSAWVDAGQIKEIPCGFSPQEDLMA